MKVKISVKDLLENNVVQGFFKIGQNILRVSNFDNIYIYITHTNCKLATIEGLEDLYDILGDVQKFCTAFNNISSCIEEKYIFIHVNQDQYKRFIKKFLKNQKVVYKKRVEVSPTWSQYHILIQNSHFPQ